MIALDRAGLPPVAPEKPSPPDAALRRLALEANGAVRQGLVGLDESAMHPGYAGVFDLIDAVIWQLSGGDVLYPPKRQGLVVRGITAVLPEV